MQDCTRDEERFEFDADAGGHSPTPALLLAIAAIAAILVVNSPLMIPNASARSQVAPATTSPKLVVMPALLDIAEGDEACRAKLARGENLIPVDRDRVLQRM
jgi:hypothetical protein